MAKERVDFSDIKLHSPHRIYRKSKSTVIGFDTESLLTGYAFLATNSLGDFVWVRSVQDVLDFLTDARYSSSFNTFWNMDFDVSVLMKWLGYEFCKELIEKKHASYDGVMFDYIPKRFFAVRKGAIRNTFYDASQYYIPRSLDGASKAYLGVAKGNLGSKEFTEAHYGSQAILEYCLSDSDLCCRLSALLLCDLFDMGLVSDTLASAGTIMESALVGVVKLPDVTKLPEGVLEYAYDSYAGGWMECFKRGYFRKLYDYDISSAYPYQVAMLPSLDEGEFVFARSRPKNAVFGFERCVVNITANVSPIIFRSDVNYTPVGTWQRTLSTIMVDLIREYSLGSVRVIDGWYFVSDRPPSHPFRYEMYRLFRMKAKARNAWLVKSCGVSLYGKLAQKDEDGVIGNLCNFIYACLVTDGTRAQIARYALDDPSRLCLVSTDGLTCNSPLPAKFLSSGFGGLRLAHHEEGVILGTSVFTIKGKMPSGEWRPGRFDWLKLLREQPNRETFELTQFRCTTLAEGVDSEEHFNKVAVFGNFPYQFDLNFDHKRLTPKVTKASDLLNNVYESMPWEVSIPQRRKEILWEVSNTLKS